MGYLLPWGQMSYWGAQVIVNLFAAIPFVGPDLALLIRGDFVVGDATLNRFFSFHVIAVPLVLLGLVVAHIIALHEVGSNNPDGVEIKAHKDADGKPLDGIPFHPYYTVHDVLGISVFLMAFSAIVFFAPEFGGYFLEYNNFIPADPLKTPAHIAPVWYFTPFYSMLRAITGEMMTILMLLIALAAVLSAIKIKMSGMAKVGILVGAAVSIAAMLTILMLLIALAAVLSAIKIKMSGMAKVGILVGAAVSIAAMLTTDAKFWGVVVMGAAVVILFFLPWLDHSPVRSMRYRPNAHKVVYGIFVINFFILGYLGIQAPSAVFERISQVGTLFYFGFFLLMPWWSRMGTFKPVPDRIVFEPH